MKLAARQEISGLGGEDLAFTPDEIKEYLAGNHNLSVSLEEAKRLAAESEGWITGILLGTHSLWKGLLRSVMEAKGKQGEVFGYLAQEVFAMQPEVTRSFLKATSILDVMRPSFCDAFLAIGNSAEVLESLEQANLFVSRLSGEEKVYRYHALFQEFLQKQLIADGPNLKSNLHQRAARLLEDEAAAEQALEHYLLAGSEADATRVLLEIMESVYQVGRLVTLQRWLDALGPIAVSRSVRLLGMRGRLCRQKGQFDEALEYFGQARDQCVATGDRGTEAAVRIREALVQRYRGAVDQARAICEDVLANYPEIASDYKTQALAHRILGEILHVAGQLPEAKRSFRRSLALYEKAGDGYQAAALLQALGTTARRMGNPLEAEAHYTRALKIAREIGNRWRAAEIENNIGVGHHYQGEYEQALQVLNRALTEAREVGHTRTEAAVLASLGDVYVDLGDYRQAQAVYLESLERVRVVKDFFLEVYDLCAFASLSRVDQAWEHAHALLDEAVALGIPEGPGYLRGLVAYHRGVVLLDQGDIGRAIVELESSENSFVSASAKRDLAKTYLWLAMARYRMEEQETAVRLLGQALDLCQEIAHPYLLVADSRRMLPLLEYARQHDDARREALSQLLTRIHQDSLAGLRVTGAEGLRQVRPPSTEIRTLGASMVLVNGTPISHTAWGGPLVKELFFYLADHRSVRRESILGTFWPEYSTAKAKSVFHATMYRMRRVLPQGLIGYSGPEETYAVEQGTDTWYDVGAFEELVGQARQQATRKLGLLEEAIAIYRGAYLSDVYSEWAAHRREQLQQAFVEALVSLAKARSEAGEHTTAIDLYRRALSEEPYREDLHRELMKALVAAGRPAEAIRHHQTLVELLERELDAKPTEETEQLLRSILTGAEDSG